MVNLQSKLSEKNKETGFMHNWKCFLAKVINFADNISDDDIQLTNRTLVILSVVFNMFSKGETRFEIDDAFYQKVIDHPSFIETRKDKMKNAVDNGLHMLEKMLTIYQQYFNVELFSLTDTGIIIRREMFNGLCDKDFLVLYLWRSKKRIEEILSQDDQLVGGDCLDNTLSIKSKSGSIKISAGKSSFEVNSFPGTTYKIEEV